MSSSPDVIAPRVDPKVAVGPTTKAGGAVAGILGIAALIAALIDGDHTPETLGALAAAVPVLITVLAGRYAQAREAIRQAGGIVGYAGQVETTLLGEPGGTTYTGGAGEQGPPPIPPGLGGQG